MIFENNAPHNLESIKITDTIFINNAKIDVISPAIAMTNITYIVGEMLEDNVSYVKKNGMTETAKKSRERLLKLLDITETFNKITCDNAAFKTYNDQLLREIQELRKYKLEVLRQEKVANSI
jgi:hypothetical protein